MNWLDFFLVGVVVVCAVIGLRTGLLGAAILAVGAYVGWLAASQLSGAIGGVGSGVVETVVTVVSFSIIVVLGMVAAGLIFKALKPFLAAATMGLSSMVDRVGGLVLGLVLGLALSGAVIVGLARLTYDLAPGDLPRADETRQALEDSLGGSRAVEVFVRAAGAVPGNTLGLVPSDFRRALDVLDKEVGYGLPPAHLHGRAATRAAPYGMEAVVVGASLVGALDEERPYGEAVVVGASLVGALDEERPYGEAVVVGASLVGALDEERPYGETVVVGASLVGALDEERPYGETVVVGASLVGALDEERAYGEAVVVGASLVGALGEERASYGQPGSPRAGFAGLENTL